MGIFYSGVGRGVVWVAVTFVEGAGISGGKGACKSMNKCPE